MQGPSEHTPATPVYHSHTAKNIFLLASEDYQKIPFSTVSLYNSGQLTVFKQILALTMQEFYSAWNKEKKTKYQHYHTTHYFT